MRKSATLNRKSTLLTLSIKEEPLKLKKSGLMTTSHLSLSKSLKPDQNQYPVSEFDFTSPGKKLTKNFSTSIRSKKNSIITPSKPLQDVKNLLESKYATSSCQILESEED